MNCSGTLDWAGVEEGAAVTVEMTVAAFAGAAAVAPGDAAAEADGVAPGGGVGGSNLGANLICQITRMEIASATAIIPLRSIWE